MKKLLLTIIIFFSTPLITNAAIAFDASSSGSASSGTSFSFNHTVTGTNTVLIVGTQNIGGETTSSVTYNSVAMTQLATYSPQPYGTLNITLWYLINPSTGTHSVTVTASGTITSMNANGVSYTGVKQTGFPDASTGTNNTASTAITTNVTTIANNAWTVAYSANDNGSGNTAGTGSFKRVGDNSHGFFDSNSAITPAGSYSMTVNEGSAAKNAQIMVSMAPSPVASRYQLWSFHLF